MSGGAAAASMRMYHDHVKMERKDAQTTSDHHEEEGSNTPNVVGGTELNNSNINPLNWSMILSSSYDGNVNNRKEQISDEAMGDGLNTNNVDDPNNPNANNTQSQPLQHMNNASTTTTGNSPSVTPDVNSNNVEASTGGAPSTQPDGASPASGDQPFQDTNSTNPPTGGDQMSQNTGGDSSPFGGGDQTGGGNDSGFGGSSDGSSMDDNEKENEVKDDPSKDPHFCLNRRIYMSEKLVELYKSIEDSIEIISNGVYFPTKRIIIEKLNTLKRYVLATNASVNKVDDHSVILFKHSMYVKAFKKIIKNCMEVSKNVSTETSANI